MSSDLSLLQWNICSFRARSSILRSIIMSRNTDIVMLQETLAEGDIRVSGYNVFQLPHVVGSSRGLAILVRNTLPARRIVAPISCGENVEVLAIEMPLANEQLTVYNIYRSPTRSVLDLDELAIFSQDSLCIFGGREHRG